MARQIVLSELAGLYGLAPGAQLSAWIDGSAMPGEGQPIPLIDPATGEEMLRYPDAGMRLATISAAGAAAAQAEWMALPGAERGRRMLGWAQAIADVASDLAVLESVTTGKPLAICHRKVAYVIEIIEYYAGWCDKLNGITRPLPDGHLAYVSRAPSGPVLVVMSWRSPLITACRHAAPALAAGNAVILKPGRLTPLSALVLGQLGSIGGFPRGLLQVVPGLGPTTGNALVAQESIRKVVFTGDSAVGAQVARHCAERMKPCVLDNGGDTIGIVFDDADPGSTIQGMMKAAFGLEATGQGVGARLLVQRSVLQQVTASLTDAASRLRLGFPLEAGTDIGPTVSTARLRQAQASIEEAVHSGARLMTPKLPSALPQAGHWMSPGVLTHLSPHASLMRQTINAPLLVILPFETESEAISMANEARSGMAAVVWTRENGRAHRVAHGLRVGNVWINGFGGAHAAVPLAGHEALAEYSQAKSVRVYLPPPGTP